MERKAYLDAGTWKLSACAFPDGRSAFTDAAAGEDGPAFNDTAYAAQFPRPLGAWGYQETVGLDGEGVLERSADAAPGGHGADNVTEYILTKERVELVGGSEYVYVVRFPFFSAFVGLGGGAWRVEGWVTCERASASAVYALLAAAPCRLPRPLPSLNLLHLHTHTRTHTATRARRRPARRGWRTRRCLAPSCCRW